MAKTLPPAAGPVAEHAGGSVVYQRDDAEELNLLLTWPDERHNRRRLALAASVAIHVVMFLIALKVESLIPPMPER
jgi:hypothetical protein